MKKVLALFLSVILVFALAAPAFADETPKLITATTVTEARRGDTVTFTVSLDKTVTTKSFGLDILSAYDTTVFTVSTAQLESALKTPQTLPEDYPDEDQAGMDEQVLVGQTKQELGIAYTITRDITGKLATIKMKVKDDASFGTYTVKVLPSAKNDFEAVAVGAEITIVHDCQGFTQLNKNETQHWYECPECGKVDESTRENHKGGTATCEQLAACSVCAQPYGDHADHKWIENVDEKYYVENSLTCETPATYKKSCEVCGEAHTTETFQVGDPDPNLHIGGEATCLAKAVCTVCGLPYGDYADHVYTKKVEDAYKVSDATCNKKAVYKKSCTVCGVAHATETFETGEYDETKHVYGEVVKDEYKVSDATCNKKAVYKKSCTVCGVAHATETFEAGEYDETKHVYDEVVKEEYLVSAATCNKKAVYKKSCTVCGKAHATETFETGTFDATNHVGEKTEGVGFEGATCKKEGYTGDTICQSCGEPITIGTVIKKTPHRIENWTVSKEATETEEGEKSGKCVECEEIYTVKTAKLATSVKPENIEGVEGAKIEAVGDTKLPENTVAGVEDVTEQITELMKDEAFQAELKEYLKETGEDESKVAFAGFAYGIGFPENNATNGDAVENLDASIKLPGKVKVTIPVSATLYAGYENVTILAYDYENDKAFVMPFTYENGAIIVESNSIFNELMLVGNVKKAPAPNTTTTTANPEVPQMGDSSEVVLFITLAIVSLLTLGAMLISKRAKASK